MRDRLTGLDEFVAVADAGSFTAAAVQLRTSKSLLSDRVRALEAYLGARLFDRTTRRLSLTEAGRTYLVHARTALEKVEAAEEALQLLKDEPRGHLRIATTVNFATLYLARAMPAFRRLYPAITIEILADETVSDPAASGADVAVRFGAMRRPGTIARRIAPIRYTLCATPGYLAERGTPVHADELRRGHICLIFRSGPAWTEWRLRRGSESARIQPDEAVRTNNGTVYRALVLAGNGIGLINHFAVASDFAEGRLAPVLPDWAIEGLDDMAMWVVLPDNRATPPKVRVFIDFVSAELGERRQPVA